MADLMTEAAQYPAGSQPLAPAVPVRSSRDDPFAWVAYEHPEYRAEKYRWQFAWDHYTGECILPSKVPSYVPRKQIGETLESYGERCALADYTNHFAAVVDGFVGMVAAREMDAARKWGGLGDSQDPDTPAGVLWDDADGEDGNWITVWKQLGAQLLVLRKAWMLVDAADGNPKLVLLPRQQVKNWRKVKRQLTDVVVCEQADARAGIRSQPKAQEQYVHYNLAGWQRYVMGEDNKFTPTDRGVYSYRDRRGQYALPIYRCNLPLSRDVGWTLAKKANAILNKESERDHLLRTAQLAIKLVLAADDGLFEVMQKKLMEGSTLLQEKPELQGGGHRFIGPDPGPAAIAGEVLVRKVEEFYVSASRDYGDSARQKTATEVKQDVSAGVGAMLGLLAGALDDAENQALWRIEQTLFSATASKHFEASVERSRDFAPFDPNDVIDRLTKRYIGQVDTVPATMEAKVVIARQAAQWDGLPAEDQELEQAVAAADAVKMVELGAGLPLGPTARGELAKRFAFGALGIDKAGTVQMADGTVQPMKDVVSAEIDAATQAEYQAEQALAGLGGTGGAPGDQTVPAGGGSGGAPAPAGGAPPPAPAPAPGAPAPVPAAEPPVPAVHEAASKAIDEAALAVASARAALDKAVQSPAGPDQGQMAQLLAQLQKALADLAKVVSKVGERPTSLKVTKTGQGYEVTAK